MTTVSAYTPITPNLAELKSFCRVDGSADDSLLEMLFTAAVDEFTAYTGVILGTATCTADFGGVEVFPLPFSPAGAITSVTAYDDEGTSTALAQYTDWTRVNETLQFNEEQFRIVVVYPVSNTAPTKDILHALYQRVKFGYDYGDDLPYNGTRFFDRIAFRYRQNF